MCQKKKKERKRLASYVDESFELGFPDCLPGLSTLGKNARFMQKLSCLFMHACTLAEVATASVAAANTDVLATRVSSSH